jgi:predicted dehydrogenase
MEIHGHGMERTKEENMSGTPLGKNGATLPLFLHSEADGPDLADLAGQNHFLSPARLNLAIIGCGYWGPNLLRNFHGLAHCRVTTICDPDNHRLSALRSVYPGLSASTDYMDVVASSEIDAVIIATPLHSHFPIAKAALDAGKHTFVEKPIAASSREAEELNRLATRQRLTLMVGHTFLYTAEVQKLSELITFGAIGRLLYITGRRMHDGLVRKDCNVLWDLAPHDLSILEYILRKSPARVLCSGHAYLRPPAEDVVSLQLSYDDGVFVTLLCSWLSPRKVREMTFVGTKGMIVYDDLESAEKLKIYARAPESRSSAHIPVQPVSIALLDREEPLHVECQHFVDCVRNERPPLSDGSSGSALVRILEAADESLTFKRTVELEAR